MTERDDFFERLRADARPLRHEPDQAALARIRARIRARIEPQPTVLEMIAAWFRPVLATVALVASIAVFTWNETREEPALEVPLLEVGAPEIVMGGETYRVGD
jgi:hypothetical protein